MVTVQVKQTVKRVRGRMLPANTVTDISKADADSASDLTVRVLSKDMVASLILDGTIDDTGWVIPPTCS